MGRRFRSALIIGLVSGIGAGVVILGIGWAAAEFFGGVMESTAGQPAEPLSTFADPSVPGWALKFGALMAAVAFLKELMLS